MSCSKEVASTRVRPSAARVRLTRSCKGRFTVRRRSQALSRPTRSDTTRIAPRARSAHRVCGTRSAPAVAEPPGRVMFEG